MFSKNYTQQEYDLQDYFLYQCTDRLILSTEDFSRGTDCLTDYYREVVDKAFYKWLNERNYELSYSQICRAFFGALDKKGLLKVVE